jgi:MSHA biogenesis protein MshG
MTTPTVFEYRARTGQGEEVLGAVNADSVKQAARTLAQRGLTPVDIRASSTAVQPGNSSALNPKQLSLQAIARAAWASRKPGTSDVSAGQEATTTAATGRTGNGSTTDDAAREATAKAPKREQPGSGAVVQPARSGAGANKASVAPAEGFKLPFLGRPGKKRVQAGFGLVLRELAALLRAGVPLMRALQLAADSTAEVPVRQALQRISRDLDNGHNLVKAAEHENRASGLITPYDIAMLTVGEQTGRLPEALADLHRHREFTRATNEQVASALRYPLFVIFTCLLALVVVNIFVIPAFARVFEQARTPLPMLTLFLLGGSKFMINTWPLLLAAGAGSAWAWRRWLQQPRGRLWWDRIKLKLPIVGPILEGIVLSRLSASLSSSLGAGLTLSDAITTTARTLDNRWFESKLQQMCNDLARGNSITAASRQMGVLPPTMLQLFAIGEESGSLEELMREISQHYQSNVDYAVKRLAGTLEPILIWFLGMGVLVLALGVFMPMWDLGRSSVR